MKVWVICSDGKRRHGAFVGANAMANALHWADWGHCCAGEHDYQILRSRTVGFELVRSTADEKGESE